MYVKPQALGQGIAALLLTAREKYAIAAGYEWLYRGSGFPGRTGISPHGR